MPLRYGSQVVGVIVVSKLGLDQFDEDEVRLLEVLAGHAAVAIENARLYESARREAESATALLEFGRELATLVERDDIVDRVTQPLGRGARKPAHVPLARARRRAPARIGVRSHAGVVGEARRLDIPGREHLGGERSLRRSVRADYEPASSPSRALPGGTIRGRALRGRRSRRLHRCARRARATSASASSGCSADSRTRRSSRSRTPRATKGSSGRSSPPSRRSRTRSRRTTSTPRSMRAGSATSRFASVRRSGSTSGR